MYARRNCSRYNYRRFDRTGKNEARRQSRTETRANNGRILCKTEMIDGRTKGGGQREKRVVGNGLGNKRVRGSSYACVQRVGRHLGRPNAVNSNASDNSDSTGSHQPTAPVNEFSSLPADRHLSSFDLDEAISATTLVPRDEENGK